MASSLYRAIIDTSLGIVAGIIILSILLAKNVVGNSTAALQLAAVRICVLLESLLLCEGPFRCVGFEIS